MTIPLTEQAAEYAADAATAARGITPLETLLVRAYPFLTRHNQGATCSPYSTRPKRCSPA